MDKALLTHEDQIQAMDAILRELIYLRFFYNFSKNLAIEGGTDEHHWAADQFRAETGEEPPAPYIED